MGTLLICGYIGSVPMPGGTFMLDWQFTINQNRFEMTRITATGKQAETSFTEFPYQVCEPFLWTSNWMTQWPMTGRYCPWGEESEPGGLDIHLEYRITLSE
jgi:hypothetical protein